MKTKDIAKKYNLSASQLEQYIKDNKIPYSRSVFDIDVEDTVVESLVERFYEYIKKIEDRYCPICRYENFPNASVCQRCGHALVFSKEVEEEKEKEREKQIRRNSIVLTTSNNIEGRDILEYIDVIIKQIVVGAGLETEFFAGFTDVFGGRSKKVEDRLAELTKYGRDEFLDIAMELKADAIIGYRLDIDEISGKNTFMFMINISGTAVKLSNN